MEVDREWLLVDVDGSDERLVPVNKRGRGCKVNT